MTRLVTIPCLLACLVAVPVLACCPAPPSGIPVVNADQTVIILWDADTKTQHFIRKASFRSDADNFGFLVPSPGEPQLEESGNDAFPALEKVTAPEIRYRSNGRGIACGCSSYQSAPGLASRDEVKVLQQKLVAGFNATVIETKATTPLVKWLQDNGYSFSPEVEAWAKPYVEAGWKITALKVAKDKENKEAKDTTATALRMSFKTDRPLFPYREPDYKGAADKLGAKSRLLRVYFLADARYEGELTKEQRWSGRTVWAGEVESEDRERILKALKLPKETGPAKWTLTEFEDAWAYKLAPADVYFSRAASQKAVKREPITLYTSSALPGDVTAIALAGAMVLPLVWRKLKRRWYHVFAPRGEYDEV